MKSFDDDIAEAGIFYTATDGILMNNNAQIFEAYTAGANHAKSLLEREIKIAAWFDANKQFIKGALEHIACEYAENEAAMFRVALDLWPEEEKE